jgi:hypothetical protein
MKRQRISSILALMLLFSGLTACAPTIKKNDYLVYFNDTITGESGYKNQNGEIAIAPGRYAVCFTDTFRTYAIVAKPEVGYVAIDRQENIMYKIFPFDNGPDEPADGLFRILVNNKIGYADAASGEVVIKPQFDCAWPFENGIAEVSIDCKALPDGEHSIWVSDNWFYIDKTGKRVQKHVE